MDKAKEEFRDNEIKKLRDALERGIKIYDETSTSQKPDWFSGLNRVKALNQEALKDG